MNIAVLVFIAAAVLAVSLILALLGSRVYENSAADESQQELCGVTTYFTDRLRECESFSDVRTASLGGEIPALVISSEATGSAGSNGSSIAPDASDGTDGSEDAAEDLSDAIRETWYFVYDGQLMLTSVNSGETVSPESGEPVMDLQSANFRVLQNGLLEITVVTNRGERSAINISLADGGGGSNE